MKGFIAIVPFLALTLVGCIPLDDEEISSSDVEIHGKNVPGESANQCELFSHKEFRIVMRSDSGGVWLDAYDSLIFSKKDGEYKSALYLRGNETPEISSNYHWHQDTLAGRNYELEYDHYFAFDESCTARMIYRYDYKGIWEGPYRWKEKERGETSSYLKSSSSATIQSSSSYEDLQCFWLSEENFSRMLKADSGGASMLIYDSLQIEKTNNEMVSRLWLRGGRIPETAVYSNISSKSTVVGRNSVLGYDNRLQFDENCVVRMDYMYDTNGFWEGPYRWKNIIPNSGSSSNSEQSSSSSIPKQSSSSSIPKQSLSSSISKQSSSSSSNEQLSSFMYTSSREPSSSNSFPENSSSSIGTQPSSSSTDASSSSVASMGCFWLNEDNFSRMLKADSGAASMSIYDSLQIEKSADEMVSRLWLRGESYPETSVYSDLSTLPIIIGRNSDLGYNNRLNFDSNCIVRMDYKYDRVGYWEGLYRWIEE